MNFKKTYNLKQKFFLVQVLAGLVPMIIITVIISVLLSSEKSRQQSFAEQIHAQTKAAMIQDIKLMSEISNNLIQSPELSEYLLAPNSLRPFLENRIYAKIKELLANSSNEKKNINIILSNALGEIFINTDDHNRHHVQDIESNEAQNRKIVFKIDDKYLSIRNLIKMDDQFRDGPNAKPVGMIEIYIPYESVLQKYPQIQSIEPYEGNDLFNNIKIKFNHESTDYNFIWISLILIYAFSIFSGFFFLRQKILLPIQKLSSKVLADVKDVEITTAVDEIDFLDKAFSIAQQQQKQLIQAKAAETIARQVSHDIRSPLSALNLMMSSLDQIPEERRILIRNAVQRINDIANSLLAKSKRPTEHSRANTAAKNNFDIELLPSLVDALVSEKRIQYRDKPFVDISLNLSKSYGLFSKINTAEFKRVLSNLINNSVEAAVEASPLKIEISLESVANKILIRIKDNGKGIPPNILSELGKREISSGKSGENAGFGIGLFHACKTIESFGGEIKINSETSDLKKLGTEILILLPKAETPNWFVEKIVIPKNSQVVTLDDDISIHQIWSGRLSSIKAAQANIAHLIFSNESDFKNQLPNLNIDQCLFLVDYELLGQSKTGLDIIEQVSAELPSILTKTILVTSRFEEPNIRMRCAQLGIKFIPKTLVGFVDIRVLQN